MTPATSLPEERQAAQGFFADFPDIGTRFREDWVSATLSASTPREQLPPFFWILVDPSHAVIIGEALRLLAKDHSLGPMISELQLGDADHVNALVREMEMYHRLRSHHEIVEWKPKLPGANPKRPDLAVVLPSKKVWIEVLTIRHSKREQDERVLFGTLNKRIDDFPGNPYLISYSVEGEFEDRDVEPCLEWLRSRLKALDVPSGNEVEAEYPSDGQPKLCFTFRRAQDDRGRSFAMLFGPRVSESAGRIKGRFLDKLDELQFEAGSSDGKGYAVVLDGLLVTHNAVLSAIFGQDAVQVSYAGGRLTHKWIRQSNGVVHDPKRGRILLEEVDFFAIFKPRGRAIPEKPEIIVNETPGKMTRPEVERLFLGNAS